MNDWDAQQAIINKVNETLELARNRFDAYVHPAPSVTFDLRGRSCGGTARGTRALQFNLDWYKADPERFLAIVVPHEVAHIVTAAIAPRATAHGREWKAICKALGGDGKRTCAIPVLNGVARARRVTEYKYLSNRGVEVWVGPVHHCKLQTRGDVHPVFNRPLYTLTSRSAGQIEKTGFTGQSRYRI